MKNPIASRRPDSRFHAGRALVPSLAALLLLCGGLGRARAGEPTLGPSPEARATYWLERVIRGPEPTSFGIGKLHKDLLLDAERNLAAVPEATLERLADPATQQRIQSQDDANPWHAILAVLAAVGPRRPDVARAWAEPALRHDMLTLRRAAIEVFEALASPDDGPALIGAIERDGADRLVGPRAAALLLKLGPPWDSAAARAIYARAPADGPLMSGGLWAELPSLASEAQGGARADLLVWWSFLTENAGPRRADPVRGGNGKGRAIDPEVLAVVAVPHALTSGARAAAAARLVLARSGSALLSVQARNDASSDDPDVRDVASPVFEHAVNEAEREAIRARAARFVTALGGPTPPSPDEVASVGRALRGDESADALRLLTDLFHAIPIDAQWKTAVLAVFDALVVRSVPLGPEIERLLGVGTDASVDLALYVSRRSGGRAFIPALEAFIETPGGAPYRFRVRRELAFLYTGQLQHGGLDDAVLANFAATVVTWVEDERDPSGTGLVAVLADLGPVGEAEIAKGLRGTKRPLYVDGLSLEGTHYLGADVLAALLEPVNRRTPAPERRRLLDIAFHVSSGSATPILEGLKSRLADDGREDVASILGMIRHRIPLGR